MEQMIIAGFILAWIGGFFIGVSTLLGYMIWRLMRNLNVDKSNITNPVRLLSHVVLHPHDFGKMYYVPDIILTELDRIGYDSRDLGRRPFWYMSEDEFEGVVKSRPEE